MDSYVFSFDQYLKYTQEKEILSKAIHEEMNKHAIHSILDIGAGGGELTQLLLPGINHYYAVEKRPAYAERLRKLGVETFEGDFNVFHSNQKFDLVLISWSLESNKEKYKAFLEKAFEFVAKNGILILITYEDAPDPWEKLIKSIGFPPYEADRVAFSDLIGLLSKLGEFKHHVITIPVVTKTKEELLQSLAFVASGGFADRKEKFLYHREKINEVLEREYRTQNGYAFPFYHQFMVVRKK